MIVLGQRAWTTWAALMVLKGSRGQRASGSGYVSIQLTRSHRTPKHVNCKQNENKRCLHFSSTGCSSSSISCHVNLTNSFPHVRMLLHSALLHRVPRLTAVQPLHDQHAVGDANIPPQCMVIQQFAEVCTQQKWVALHSKAVLCSPGCWWLPASHP